MEGSMSGDRKDSDIQETQAKMDEIRAQEMQVQMKELLSRTEKNLPNIVWERSPPPDPNSVAKFYKGSCPSDQGQGPIAVCKFPVGDRESADGAVVFGGIMLRLLPELSLKACALAEAQLQAAGK
jgi:hypothetical protein